MLRLITFTMAGLDLLRQNLLEHLVHMNKWKDYLEQDHEYESETVQLQAEKDIAVRPFEDQVEYLSISLSTENNHLENLLRQREIEAEQEKLVLEETKGSKDDDGEDKKKKKKHRKHDR